MTRPADLDRDLLAASLRSQLARVERLMIALGFDEQIVRDVTLADWALLNRCNLNREIETERKTA